jgi:tRNA dimethylallyltransferase
MGPTASGKTDVAVELVAVLPLEIVSVDSAMVYRHMDIGTAKPDPPTLARAPHRLLDIRDPEERYSAGDFVRDAEREMADIRSRGRVPFLVGGTMLYFRALTAGMAALPSADSQLRAAIDEEAAEVGWPAMHRQLREVDADAASRISPNDSQRIQRALEVWRATGKPLSTWHREQAAGPATRRFVMLGLLPADRAALHRRIANRLERMFAAGFVDEVRRLRSRPGVLRESPAMRAVGYRQVWANLEGEKSLEETIAAARAATRQLAKRQMTWMRSQALAACVDPLEGNALTTIKSIIGREMMR